MRRHTHSIMWRPLHNLKENLAASARPFPRAHSQQVEVLSRSRNWLPGKKARTATKSCNSKRRIVAREDLNSDFVHVISCCSDAARVGATPFPRCASTPYSGDVGHADSQGWWYRSDSINNGCVSGVQIDSTTRKVRRGCPLFISIQKESTQDTPLETRIEYVYIHPRRRSKALVTTLPV